MAGDLVIKYRSTGSNTTASGCGPATAVTGSNAYSGDGAGGGTQTVIDLSGDTPDLSAVQVGDILFLDTGTGNTDIYLFEITAVNDGADTVTVSVAPDTAISSGSPVNWAIGGNRLDPFYKVSQQMCDFSQSQLDWVYELEGGQTYDMAENFLAPSSFTSVQTAPLVRSSSRMPGGSRAVITMSVVQTADWCLNGHSLEFDLSNMTTSASRFPGGGYGAAYKFCKFKDYGDAAISADLTLEGTYIDCEFFDCGNATYAISFSQANAATGKRGAGLTRCVFNDCGQVEFSPDFAIDVLECVFLNSLGNALVLPLWSSGNRSMYRVSNCTIVGPTSDGIYGQSLGASTAGRWHDIHIHNCSITDCGGYGINFSGVADAELVGRDLEIGYNHFDNNTSGNHNWTTTDYAGHNSVTGAPVFVNETAGSEDFHPDTSSPLINAGLEPAAIPQS